MDRFEQLLRRFGPLATGLISPLVMWWVWGQIVPVAVIHDEASYLLQADIFASGRWTAPSPPIPQFFEQPHVQVVPALASKYPPGHSLVLAIGALVGFPPLMPLLLTGITAALLFALATRVVNPWVALVAWPTWLFAPMVLRFQPSYLSELTTTPLVLASWWSLLSRRETRRRRWLLGLALCVGWGAITRPLTMLMFAIPIGVVVIADVVRTRGWRDLALAVAVGIATLSILPVWSAKTTGSWHVTPIEKYRRDYFPFDKIGFDADTTHPRRAESMSKVLVETYWFFLAARKQQSLEMLPITVWQRVIALAEALFQGPRLPLLLASIIGLWRAPPALRFAAISAFLLFLAHLPYAHWARWTVYYLEAVPVAATFAGLGLWRLTRRLPDAHAAAVMATAAALVTSVGVLEARRVHARRMDSPSERLHRQLVELLPTLPSPGIVFVRPSPRLRFNPDLVRNSADLNRAPIWVVHDLGPRNEELKRLSPKRASHSLDVDALIFRQQSSAP